jgi:hypothetical protein
MSSSVTSHGLACIMIVMIIVVTIITISSHEKATAKDKIASSLDRNIITAVSPNLTSQQTDT